MDSVAKIERYTEGIDYENFLGDELLQDGVIRQLQIIGESSKRISKEFKKKNSAIPWRDIAGFRDKVVHDYAYIDLEPVWEAASKDIPELKQKLQEK